MFLQEATFDTENIKFLQSYHLEVLPAASVCWDDGYGERHEVDEETGDYWGRGVDGRPGALSHSFGEKNLEDDGEPDDGIEDGGDGGDEVDVVVKPEPGPDQGLHEDQGHEVNKHGVQQLVNCLECGDTLARRVILNVNDRFWIAK